MTAQIPTTEPDSLIAGDTVKWIKTLEDYLPQDGWSLVYTLINAYSKIILTSTAQGSDHLIHASAATSQAWDCGNYNWRSRVINAYGEEAYTLNAGSIKVLPGFNAATLDNRSHAQKTLDNIEAYLENPQNITAARYEIQGRNLERFRIPELLAMRDRYRSEVFRETNAANVARGLPDKRRVLVRFG